jgi:hypothetical protein
MFNGGSDMDPDANLKEQRELAKCILARFGDSADAERLAELVEALDGWIRLGGGVPHAWKRDR